ncbi:Os04g0389800, partial [Oryza sativa Japonica Group]
AAQTGRASATATRQGSSTRGCCRLHPRQPPSHAREVLDDGVPRRDRDRDNGHARARAGPDAGAHGAAEGRGHRRRGAGAVRRPRRVRVPGRRVNGDPPGADAVAGDPQPPAPPRAGGGLRGVRVRALVGAAGRLRRHLRPGRHQPRVRARRRPPRLRPARRHHGAGPAPHDRHRRVPGDAHRRVHPLHHQAQLPNPRRRRHPPRHQRGLLPRVHGSPRPGARRHPQGHPAADGRAVLGRADAPPGVHLPAAEAAGRQPARRSHPPRRRRREARPLRRRRVLRVGLRAAALRGADGHPGDDHPHGHRELPQRRPALAADARDAWHCVRQLRRRQRRPPPRARRALRRPRHRQSRGVREQGQDRARRHRPVGAREEQAAARLHLRRRQARPAGHERDAGRTERRRRAQEPRFQRVALGAGEEEGRVPTGLQNVRRGDPAAVRHPGARRGHQRGGHRRHGRRAAPDVGDAALHLQEAQAVALVRRAGRHGLRPACRRRRRGGQPGRHRGRHRRRRQPPDEHPGARHGPRRGPAGEGDGAEQPAPGHGGAVGGQVLRRQQGAHLPRQPGGERRRRGVPGLRDDRRRLRHPGGPRDEEGRGPRRRRGDDGGAGAVPAGRRRASPGARAADDPQQWRFQGHYRRR